MSSLDNNALVPSNRAQRAFGTLNRSHVLYINGILPLSDLCCFLLSAGLASRIDPVWLASTQFHQQGYLALLAAMLGATLLYDRRFGSIASRGNSRALIRYYLIGFVKFTVCLLLIGAVSRMFESIPYAVSATWLLLGLVLTAATRMLLATKVRRLARSGVLTEVVAIVGASPLAERLSHHLRQTRPLNIDLLGVFDDVGRPAPNSPPVAGNIDELIELGKTRHIDWIFLTLLQSDEQRLVPIVNRLKSLSVNVALCPRNVGLQLPYYMIDYIGDGVPVALLVNRPQQRWWPGVRAIGQFLPRWITTLLLMPALLLSFAHRRLRPKLRALATARLSCQLDTYDLESFLEVAKQFGQQQYGYVVTPNVDHLIRLHEDASFRSLYAQASYVLLDSRFLARLLRLTRRVRLPVCPGSDLTLQLFERVIRADDRVVVIGGTEGQVRQVVQRYALGNVAHYNPPYRFIDDPAAVEACLQFVEAHSPARFCLLAVGSPQQEILAQRLQARGIARGLTLCIGASIDFMTGVELRAPRWLRSCGLEWLYRLLQNPARMTQRYLVRGPRVFALLRKTSFVTRAQAENCAQIKAAA